MTSRGYVIARYEVHGQRFEVIVRPDLAFQFKEGKPINIDEALIGDYVYKDVRKGLKASPEELRRVFGTTDIKKIATEIIKKGELQITAEQRKRLLENKRRQIINYIAKSAIDPRSKTPIPPSRIERAMEEVRVTIDIYKGVEEQAVRIVKEIAKVLPIKLAKAILLISIPPMYAARAYNQVAKLGDVKKVNWLANGSVLMELEIPAGLQSDVISKIASITKGSADVKVLKVT